ncbi:MAG: RNA polymerase sigma factor [Ferruginibacter sp.]
MLKLPESLSQERSKEDQLSFEQLVAQYSDMVYNTALSMLQQQQDAEDVTQEVFVKVYQSMGKFSGNAQISTWIYRITVNQCIDVEKKKNRKKRFSGVLQFFSSALNDSVHVADFHHPGIALEKKEDAAILFKALQQLNTKQRMVFVLNKLEGLKAKEIAEIMQASATAIESLLARANKQLKIILKQYYEQHHK